MMYACMPDRTYMHASTHRHLTEAAGQSPPPAVSHTCAASPGDGCTDSPHSPPTLLLLWPATQQPHHATAAGTRSMCARPAIHTRGVLLLPTPRPPPLHRCRLRWLSRPPVRQLLLLCPCLAAHATEHHSCLAARQVAQCTGQACCWGGGRWRGPGALAPPGLQPRGRCWWQTPPSRGKAATVCTPRRWQQRLCSSCEY